MRSKTTGGGDQLQEPHGRLQTRLVAALLFVVLLPSLVGLYTTLELINARIQEQARYKIGTDLNLARALVQNEYSELKDKMIDLRRDLELPRAASDLVALERLIQSGTAKSLDIVLVTDAQGRVVARRAGAMTGDDVSGDFFVRRALRGQTLSGLQVISANRVRTEGIEERVKIAVVPSDNTYATETQVERRAMLVKAATPVHDARGKRCGALVVATLLNGNTHLVDAISAETRGDQVSLLIGPATVATTVRMADGRRALGTLISDAVGRRVLDAGRAFSGEARVWDHDSIAAYEPLKDIEGNIVGMLHVGTPTGPFVELRRNTIRGFGLIAFLTLGVALSIGAFGVHWTISPVQELAGVAQRMAAGDYSARAKTQRKDEIGLLCAEFNHMADQLQSQIDELNRLNQLKNEFIAVASHELRTPVTFIRSYIELINKGAYDDRPEELRERLAKIERNSVRLSSLLNDLLDLSKLERHELTIRHEELSVKALAEEVLGDVTQVASEKGLIVVSEFGDDELRVCGDEERLRRVFVNLLDNSVKFSKAGDTVRMRGSRRDDEDVEFVVEDTGAGMAEEDIPFIFSPFFQTEASIRRTHSGLGLGLSMAKNIIELHGGTIAVESRLGEGTRVTVALPSHKSAPVTESEASRQES